MVDNRGTEEVCIICKQKKERGIHICEQFICRSCEQAIIQTKTTDRRYGHYLEQLKKIKQTLP